MISRPVLRDNEGCAVPPPEEVMGARAPHVLIDHRPDPQGLWSPSSVPVWLRWAFYVWTPDGWCAVLDWGRPVVFESFTEAAHAADDVCQIEHREQPPSIVRHEDFEQCRAVFLANRHAPELAQRTNIN